MPDSGDLLERLARAQVAGCTCLTKTPVWTHHDPNCHYRLFTEAAGLILVLTEVQGHMHRDYRRKVRETGNARRKAAYAHDRAIAAVTRAHDARLRFKSAEGSLKAIGRDLADYKKELGDKTENTADLAWLIASHRVVRSRIEVIRQEPGLADKVHSMVKDLLAGGDLDMNDVMDLERVARTLKIFEQFDGR